MAQSIRDCLLAAEQLASVSESPRLDVELILAWVLAQSRTYLFTWPERELSAAQQAAFEQALARRLKGEPVAYIVGQQGFWTLDLQVAPSTLIPRPETELLVEAVLQRLPESPAMLLDLGTGTGAIALAVASERPQWRCVAVDKMPDAVALAERNRERLQLHNVRCLQSDWFANVGSTLFDVVVSNPPYIDSEDPHLQQGDVRYEPQSALVAAEKGLADIDRIVTKAKRYMVPGGLLLLEHGWEQGQAVRKLFTANRYSQVETLCDLAGHERVTLGYV